MLGGKEVIALQPCLSQSTNRIPPFNVSHQIHTLLPSLAWTAEFLEYTM